MNRCELADYIDLAYLLQQNPLKKPLTETSRNLINKIGDFAVEFMEAAIEFNGYLYKTYVGEHLH